MIFAYMATRENPAFFKKPAKTFVIQQIKISGGQFLLVKEQNSNLIKAVFVLLAQS